MKDADRFIPPPHAPWPFHPPPAVSHPRPLPFPGCKRGLAVRRNLFQRILTGDSAKARCIVCYAEMTPE